MELFPRSKIFLSSFMQVGVAWEFARVPLVLLFFKTGWRLDEALEVPPSCPFKWERDVKKLSHLTVGVGLAFPRHQCFWLPLRSLLNKSSGQIDVPGQSAYLGLNWSLLICSCTGNLIARRVICLFCLFSSTCDGMARARSQKSMIRKM